MSDKSMMHLIESAIELVGAAEVEHVFEDNYVLRVPKDQWRDLVVAVCEAEESDDE